MLAKKYLIRVVKMLEQSRSSHPKSKRKEDSDAFVRVELDENGNPRLISNGHSDD